MKPIWWLWVLALLLMAAIMALVMLMDFYR